MTPKFKNLGDGSVFVPSIGIFYDGQLVQPGDENRIRGAGIKALRCNAEAARITTYPTEMGDLDWIRAVHVAIRTGDFYRISKMTGRRYAVFGLIVREDVYAWLKESVPGKPLATIVEFLAYIQRRDTDNNVMEAQVEPTFYEQVFRRAARAVNYEKIPAFISDTEPRFFNLDIGMAYLRSDDWTRIVKRGESDDMERCESRCDVWQAWLELTADRWNGRGIGLAAVARNKHRKRIHAK